MPVKNTAFSFIRLRSHSQRSSNLSLLTLKRYRSEETWKLLNLGPSASISILPRGLKKTKPQTFLLLDTSQPKSQQWDSKKLFRTRPKKSQKVEAGIKSRLVVSCSKPNVAKTSTAVSRLIDSFWHSLLRSPLSEHGNR